MMMTDRDKELLTIIGQEVGNRLLIIKEQLAKELLSIHRSLPIPEVHNEVETPKVYVRNEVAPAQIQVVVDTRPLADAIASLGSIVNAALEHNAEMLSQLLVILADRPAMKIAPVIRVPESPITVTAPHVTLEHNRKPRTVTFKTDKNGVPYEATISDA